MEEELLEGTLETIDWSGMGRVINRTNVIELAPDSSYLFVVNLGESVRHEIVKAVREEIENTLRSLLGDECLFRVLLVSGDMSLEAYRFQEATE